MIGKRITLNRCPGCNKPHEIWLPGLEYFDATKTHFYDCPETGKTYWFGGLDAAVQDGQEPNDLIGRETPVKPESETKADKTSEA